MHLLALDALLAVHQQKSDDEWQSEQDDAQHGDDNSQNALVGDEQRAAAAEQQYADGKHCHRNWIQVHVLSRRRFKSNLRALGRFMQAAFIGRAAVYQEL